MSVQGRKSPNVVSLFGALAKPLPDTPALFGLDDRSLAAEQYRSLAVQLGERIQQSQRPAGSAGYVLTVTSPDAGIGKTLTSLNLALTLARGQERRVLLVEGDLWRPKLSEYFDVLPGHPGVLQLLMTSAKLKQAVVSVPLPEGQKLDLVTAGGSGQIGDLLSGPRMPQLVRRMAARYEIVILDSPPLVLASGRSLSSIADGTLVVVGAGRSKRGHIEDALEILGPERTLGMVLNRVHPRSVKGSAYQAYSSYYESDPPTSAEPAEGDGTAESALDRLELDLPATETPERREIRVPRRLVRAAVFGLLALAIGAFLLPWRSEEAVPAEAGLGLLSGGTAAIGEAPPVLDGAATGGSSPIDTALPARGEPTRARAHVRARVRQWANSWSGQAVESYLGFYSSAFTPDAATTRSDWMARSEGRLTTPEFIEVELGEVGVDLRASDRATAKFVQDYRSDRYADRVTKILEWKLEDGEWRIVGEWSEPAP